MRRTLLPFLLLALCPSAFAGLVPDGATPEKVADGYQFTEGPALIENIIVFSDIPASIIVAYDIDTGQTMTVVENTRNTNGLMLHNRVLYGCSHGARALVKFADEGAELETVWGKLFERDDDGTMTQKRLNSPNDLTIDKDGGIYFTDPRYGNRDSMETDTEGVYYYKESAKVSDDGGVEVYQKFLPIDTELKRPNGIVLSPDQKTLYVADNGANWIYAYDIVEPGKVKNKRKLAQLNDGKGGGSDGMCVDAKGRLYATGHGKVWVFEPTGDLVATIPVGPQTTNCTFGPKGKTLYITANKGLYRITLNTDAPLEHAKAEENETN
ncbi:MAG: SMP-30/gluconolactonase/LRE family protein [Phycisphaeraceae bacterium]